VCVCVCVCVCVWCVYVCVPDNNGSNEILDRTAENTDETHIITIILLLQSSLILPASSCFWTLNFSRRDSRFSGPPPPDLPRTLLCRTQRPMFIFSVCVFVCGCVFVCVTCFCMCVRVQWVEGLLCVCARVSHPFATLSYGMWTENTCQSAPAWCSNRCP
jgi:hypothetical protein